MQRDALKNHQLQYDSNSKSHWEANETRDKSFIKKQIYHKSINLQVIFIVKGGQKISVTAPNTNSICKIRMMQRIATPILISALSDKIVGLPKYSEEIIIHHVLGVIYQLKYLKRVTLSIK